MNNDHEICGANIGFLARLFYEARSEGGAPRADLRLSQMYKRMQITQDVWGPLEPLLKDHLDFETLTDVENAVSEIAGAHEQQGFVNGFRMGMMLRDELTG